MSSTLITIEMDTQIKQWLESYCHKHNIPFSEALNHHLTISRQVAENEKEIISLSIPQKLLLQCVVESFLLLREIVDDKDKLALLTEKAKVLIRNTLKEDPACPLS